MVIWKKNHNLEELFISTHVDIKADGTRLLY